MSYQIRQVRYFGPLFADLLAEACAGDGQFVSRLRDHWLGGSERFDRPGEILLGAFAGDDLVGMAGITYDPYQPEVGLGRVRHVYVLSTYRKRGVAISLMRKLIRHAEQHFAELRLQTSNPAAARLYESLGFICSTHGRETHRLRLRTHLTGT